MRFAEIGQQLRAYRLESGLRAEEIAARLGVSRAALYRYEKGEVIKLDTIRRLAELLKISPLSLLGIGVEYFGRPAAFQERLRQVEEQSDQVLQVGGALCYPVTTDAFDGALAEAWTEVADASPDRLLARTQTEQMLGLLTARKRLHLSRKPNIIAILSEGAIARMLTDGVAAGLAVSDRARMRCRLAARAEAEAIAEHMESVPIGLQIGLISGPEPSASFMVMRGRERAHVVGSAFAADAHPTATTGVSFITAADEAVGTHQRVAEAAWRDALKGPEAAARLRALVKTLAGG
ncbi:helix-turn-helix transcriptional regulator [Roseomonas alkaliterrae]|jgi:transcriptional regulator with XRE-family HTH domain|uniref:Transcriptional regulator with XRE-family HTH domain n=1 Tax=Neoroseomonas alkaliterrae TaxID=1452450 RepID=A0A840Y4T3_9PROT|nr:helix-turn-helix transcriptional regulator [Neoroseomonas alkaliterrae]MBB5689642.1 transcriptional regulator with XRE-family HTH domain [Neoroseomonas alkaliterrae]MBR0677318.1 helix-turn-helix transcriptional regulator [Neoroseomonas alkaliterrae]